MINRSVFFDRVRQHPFNGSLDEGQVDGMNAILDEWDNGTRHAELDRRWLAYMLATTFHETAQEMQPIEEYGKGEGMQYGEPDPTTGQTYYGRGFVQLTWRENYARADGELNLKGDDSCEWHADNALRLDIATQVMFLGMMEGWFRTHEDGKPETLARYFSAEDDEPYLAREIINGDKHIVPSWSNGISIGNLIAGYHGDFLEAIEAAEEAIPTPFAAEVMVNIVAPPGIKVVVNVSEKEIPHAT